MIFVDTGVWVASASPTESRHAVALQLLDTAPEPLLTTDYIVDEALTLLTARGRRAAAIVFGGQVFAGIHGRIQFLSEKDVRDAWDVFRRFHDKDWSFTDCTSYVVMQRLNIKTAFSFDQHFKQFGIVAVVP